MLVERAPRLRAGGYVVDFSGLGYDIAERMSLLPELERRGYHVEEVRFVDAAGRRVGGFSVGVFRSLPPAGMSLARSDLAGLIYRKIEGRCETMFGDSIAGIEQTGDGVHVAFERAPAQRFNLLIGADGLHSTVRRLVFGSVERFEDYLGYMVAAFEVDGYRPRDEGVYVSYAAPGRQVARFAMRGDRTLFLFVFAAVESPSVDSHEVGAHNAVLHGVFEPGRVGVPANPRGIGRLRRGLFRPREPGPNGGVVVGTRCPSRRCRILPVALGRRRIGACHDRGLRARGRARRGRRTARHRVPALRAGARFVHCRQAEGCKAISAPLRPRRNSVSACAIRLRKRLHFPLSPISCSGAVSSTTWIFRSIGRFGTTASMRTAPARLNRPTMVCGRDYRPQSQFASTEPRFAATWPDRSLVRAHALCAHRDEGYEFGSVSARKTATSVRFRR